MSAIAVSDEVESTSVDATEGGDYSRCPMQQSPGVEGNLTQSYLARDRCHLRLDFRICPATVTLLKAINCCLRVQYA
jgi:hypothetical protein